MMKKVFLFLLAIALIGCSANQNINKEPPPQKEEAVTLPPPAPVAPEKAPVTAEVTQEAGFKAFVVYADKGSRDNHFIPSGWLGDYADIKFNDGYNMNTHSGATCIKIEYLPNASGGARWAGIYWQYPQNNWGNIDTAYDITGAKKLTFWVRGETGSENIQEFKFGGISGEYPDSDSASIGPISLTAEWKQYEIDLSGKDLSHIIGGFAWSTNLDVNPQGAVFYLDDIKFE